MGAEWGTPILWHSNAPWAPSGYGKQTRLFAPRLKAVGHRSAISAFWGLQGAVIDYAGIPVYPRALDGHGNDVLKEHAAHFFGHPRDGLVLTLTDVWVLRAELLRELNVAAWVPVDHEPCQPPTVDALRDGRCIPVAMSRFGERMLLAEGLSPVYVPHGVETGVFREHDRLEARRRLGIPESAFLVGMVAANISERKAFPQAVAAFAELLDRHPEAVLYLHTWLGPQYGGLDLERLLRQHLPHTATLTCDQYRYANGMFGDAYLAGVYSAMDVLLNPAMGEGFGVPIVEAQACGTPVVVTAGSSMGELVGAGSAVDGAPFYTRFGSWQLHPDVDGLVAALEAEYARPEAERLGARRRAREFAAGYDADLVTDRYWRPALVEIAGRIERPPSPRRVRPRRGPA